MREPKRLAHRQAERNKAKAQKQWHQEGSGEDEADAAPEPGEQDIEGSASSQHFVIS